MTPERAKEILQSIHDSHGWKCDCTDAEREEIRTVWHRLPGWTCLADAVCSIAYPEKWQASQQ